jgi:dolichol-phosphate mannosyltransferase
MNANNIKNLQEKQRSCLVPTTDPQAALEFCRSLAQLLASPSNAFVLDTVNRGRFNTGAPKRLRSNKETAQRLSVVIPVYNEEENLPELFSRLSNVLQNSVRSYEIVFIDDGSEDQSVVILQQLAEQDPRVVVIELARNFGHQVAISAGLEHCRGEIVAVMDADLQDTPENLPEFIAKISEGNDVVYAVREKRKEPWFMRFAYASFYRILEKVAAVKIPLDAGDFCIMNRKVVDLLVSMPERNRFVRGIRSWIGLKQVGVPCERHARHAGKPKYSFVRLIALALDGLISFSLMPLRIITILGFSVSFISLAVALFYVVKKLTLGIGVPGFTTLVVAIFFLAGIQLITIGVIGEYVGRIADEVKQRPLYITRRIIRREG